MLNIIMKIIMVRYITLNTIMSMIMAITAILNIRISTLNMIMVQKLKSIQSSLIKQLSIMITTMIDMNLKISLMTSLTFIQR